MGKLIIPKILAELLLQHRTYFIIRLKPDKKFIFLPPAKAGGNSTIWLVLNTAIVQSKIAMCFAENIISYREIIVC
jgi:hypothetical protein